MPFVRNPSHSLIPSKKGSDLWDHLWQMGRSEFKSMNRTWDPAYDSDVKQALDTQIQRLIESMREDSDSLREVQMDGHLKLMRLPFDEVKQRGDYRYDSGELAEVIKAGADLVPISVGAEGESGPYWVLDGHHRLRAYGMVGKPALAFVAWTTPKESDQAQLHIDLKEDSEVFTKNPRTGLRPVKGCPHARMGPEEPSPSLGLVMTTCKDCGGTFSRPDPSVEGYEEGDLEEYERGQLVDNPPWTDRILESNADEIEESGQPQPANLIGGMVVRKRAPQELGAGSYGAVYATEDPDVVFKVTSDPTEVNFIRAAMRIGDWPKGIVRYKAVINFPEKFRNRNTFGIWREAAFPVGLQDGMDYAKTTYDEVELQEFNFYLRWFLANAGIARDTLKRAKNPAKIYEDSKRYEQWAWDNVGPAEAKPPWKYFGQKTVFFAERFRGAQRVAAALRACESIAEEMGSTNRMNYVGEALGFYLDNGILLADVHGDNVGVVHRDDGYGEQTLWVITDPGHAVFLDEL